MSLCDNKNHWDMRWLTFYSKWWIFLCNNWVVKNILPWTLWSGIRVYSLMIIKLIAGSDHGPLRTPLLRESCSQIWDGFFQYLWQSMTHMNFPLLRCWNRVQARRTKILDHRKSRNDRGYNHSLLDIMAYYPGIQVSGIAFYGP